MWIRLLSLLITAGLFAVTAAWVPFLDFVRRWLREEPNGVTCSPVEEFEQETLHLQPTAGFLPEVAE